MSPPMRSPTSPIREPQLPQTLRNGISPAQAETVKYGVTYAAEQPVKKKKKKAAPGSAEGSHFERGSMEPRTVTTPLEPGSELPPEPVSEPVKKKKKKKAAVTGESSHFPSDSGSSQAPDPESPIESDRRTQRASGLLLKQPSVVREDWEGEQEQERTAAEQREDQGLSPVSSPASVQGKKLTAANMSRKIEEPQPQPKQAAGPGYHAVTTDEPASPTAPQLPKEQYLQVEQPQSRTTSVSPSRATRFSDYLSSDLASGKKHEPLPRSVSPVKSALKHHALDGSALDPNAQRVRDASVTPSDASDSNMSADGSVRRKKSARVSFEPDVEIVGIAAESQETESPTIASPQSKDTGKRSFFGFGRTKPALTTIPSEEDIEEHMKPRPQLPSFSSTRSKNRRIESSESVEGATPPQIQKLAPPSTATPSTSSASSSNANTQVNDQGASSDHAIGGVLAQQVASQAARFSTYAPALAPPTRDPNLPLPPEVTSVEGSGYVSDTESDSSDEEVEETSVRPQVQPVEPSVPAPAEKMLEPTPVSTVAEGPTRGMPTVAVQPPTPSIEQTNPTDQYEVEVPGGFPVSSENVAKLEEKRVPTPLAQKGATTSPSGLGIAEPEPPAPVPVKASKAESTEESEDGSTDNASIYSDAEEDLSDVEGDGDGFGSINAIVESPIVTSPQRDRVMTPPESPLAQVSNRPTQHDRTTSWEEAQQKWSGIAQQTRESVGQQPAQKTTGGRLEESKWAQAPAQLQPAPQIEKPKKKKKSHTATAAALASGIGPKQVQVDSPPRVPNQSSAYPPVDSVRADQNRESGAFRQSLRTQPVAQAPAQGGFRGSMRGQQPAAQPETGFRSSLRGQPPAPQGESGFRSSMRGQAPPARPKSPPQPVARPRAPQPIAAPVSPPRAALQKKHIPPGATAQPRAPPANRPLPRRFSNDSDSDSSFRRTRRSKANATGSYSMKRSMRANAPPQPTPAQPAGRGAVRSLSPPQRRPFSPTGESKAFRSTMRSSLDDAGPTLRGPAPTMRGQPDQKRSSSFFGKRKAKSPSPAAAKSRPFSGGIQSRIKDSDDEDEPRKPTTFRSRFQDSSDEDSEPQTFRPVRGIPRKGNESESTDLEDSSDEEKKTPKVQKAKPQTLKVNTTPPAAASQPPEPTSPSSPTKKKGLFSRFRSKKENDKNEPSLLRPTRAPVRAGASRDDEDEEEEKVEGMGNMGFGSSAERDEMIRQTMAKLEAAKKEEQQQSSPAPPARPQRQAMGQRVMSDSSARAQRQGMGERVMSDSWPLPEQTSSANDSTRPSTSSGVLAKTNGNAIRPAIGQRTPTGETNNSTVSYGRSGKKKRFPMLRKAFGLKD